MKIKITVLLLWAYTLSLSSQNNNVFLDRSFWSPETTISAVKQAIKKGNDITEFDENNFDAVVKSIFGNAPLETIEYLLSFDGNGIDKRTHDKRTYIFWAAYSGNVALIEKLIEKKASVNVKDSHQFSPLTFAASAGQTNIEVYKLLIDAGIDIKTDKDGHGANGLLLAFTSVKDFSLVAYFISQGALLTDTDDLGNGAFNYAAKGGNQQVLQELISRGLPYNKPNKNGGNAMLFATMGSRKGYQSLEKFKFLESLGVEANITNNDGINAIHNLSSGNKDIASFEFFKSKGVSVDQVDSKGNNPLIKAAERNSLKVVTWLEENTKSINHKNNEGETCLTKSMGNNPKVIQYLLDQKSDINVIDAKGNNIVYHLFRTLNRRNSKDFKIKLDLLKNNGFDIAAAQKNGNTLYHLAAEKNNEKLLKSVSNLGVDINVKNTDGLTALHIAVMSATNMKTIDYLLSLGADKSIRTDFDETVYQLAKENEQLNSKEIKILK